ncbi:helix-turn-helix domain-containing protein [Deinococcus marmoris]|uniref:helix-turn-helix domain-containing protein n=1 Tax=Deinococcus marmoris TaxID=249408 RepID=UPI00049769C4|nr:helix-turn-helix domain-containing protein [Deinococcus marmoris]
MTLNHTPNPAEQHLARDAQHLLARQNIQLRAGEDHLTLTPELAGLLRGILERLGNGESITVLSRNEELSTQQAAELLGVSRPYLIEQLLEGRKIPFRKVGKHRRIRVRDLLAFQERDQAEKRALVREITEIGQEIDPY